MLESALLSYELFLSTLVKIGFELNPYDKCLANKNIDGKRCTIGWYVDGTKVSHVSNKVCTEVIDEIKN